MTQTKQQLIIIEGKNEHCKNKEHDRDYHLNFGWDCCKSSTKLYFNAEEFKCDRQWYIYVKYQDKRSFPNHLKTCECKGTGYLLLKKGDTRYLCPKCGLVGIPHPHKDCKKFRLSSDAVLIRVGEYCKYPISTTKTMFCEMEFEKHNLSESSKIVICEGYYE